LLKKELAPEMNLPAPIVVADRFPALLEILLDLLSGFSPEDWEQPATPQGWTVKDIALHLLGDDLGLLSGRRDGFSEGQVEIDQWMDLVTWINERNHEWVAAARRISPRLLRDLLKFTGDQVNAYFLHLDPFAMGGPVSWAGPDPAPVWLDIAREFTERWHHQQHVRDALGKAGLMLPYYLAPVLATFVRALPQTYRSIAAPQDTCVSLVITGGSGGDWSVVRHQERWQLYEGKPPQPHAQVVLGEDDAWRLFTKGVSKDAARQRALLLGDQELAMQMLETVSIIA
jgi:uncharacterized protein (TIGR03083 family)